MTDYCDFLLLFLVAYQTFQLATGKIVCRNYSFFSVITKRTLRKWFNRYLQQHYKILTHKNPTCTYILYTRSHKYFRQFALNVLTEPLLLIVIAKTFQIFQTKIDVHFIFRISI